MAAQSRSLDRGVFSNPQAFQTIFQTKEGWIKKSEEWVWVKDCDIKEIPWGKCSTVTKLRLEIISRYFEAWRDGKIDLSIIPHNITAIWCEASGRLNDYSFSTLPKHLVEVRIDKLEVVDEKQGQNASPFLYVIPPQQMRFNFLTSIRVLRLGQCGLDTLDWVPGQLDVLHLEECTLHVRDKQSDKLTLRSLWGEYEKFSLKTLKKVNELILERCKEFVRIEFADDAQIQSLRIWNHDGPKLVDENFNNFPKSLAKFEIKGADITDKTIEKLDVGLHSLSLEDCPQVTMGLGRAQLYFPGCTFNGLKKEAPQTAKFRMQLEQSVIGQPQAIDAAFQALCISLAGIKPGPRPAGIFLFVGPSGVGKTELAKTVALVGKRQLLRYDMGEYQLEHEVTKFIGSPTGYKGNEKGGLLTNDVQKYPDAVVLFDEIEKAHTTVHRALLGVFEGHMTDGKGKMTDFQKTIIIMTSNLGAEIVASLDWANVEVALKKSESIVLELLKKKIAPEFVGRIDAVVPFRPLEAEVVRNIMKSKVKRYEEDIEAQTGIQLVIDDNVWQPLCENLDPALGARKVVMQFEREVNAAISTALLNGFVRKGDKIGVFREGQDIQLRLIRV